MEIDVQKILAQHLRDVEQAEYQNNAAQSDLESVMEHAFLDPRAARKRMDDYGRVHGRQALCDKLGEKNVTRFGRRPGSILSGEGYRPGADQQRRDADTARQSLPTALRKADESQARLEQAQRTYRDARERYGLPAAAPALGNAPEPTDGKKNAVGTLPVRDMVQAPENARPQPALAIKMQEPQTPSQRPLRFSEVSRGRPDEPVAFRQPQPGSQPPPLREGFRPRPPTQPAPAEEKPRSFSETLRKEAPDVPRRSGSFSNKLAQMRERPSESEQGQDKGRRSRDRSEDLER